MPNFIIEKWRHTSTSIPSDLLLTSEINNFGIYNQAQLALTLNQMFANDYSIPIENGIGCSKCPGYSEQESRYPTLPDGSSDVTLQLGRLIICLACPVRQASIGVRNPEFNPDTLPCNDNSRKPPIFIPLTL